MWVFGGFVPAFFILYSYPISIHSLTTSSNSWNNSAGEFSNSQSPVIEVFKVIGDVVEGKKSFSNKDRILVEKSRIVVNAKGPVKRVILNCKADYPIQWEVLYHGKPLPSLDVSYSRGFKVPGDVKFVEDLGKESNQIFSASLTLRGLLESQSGIYICKYFNRRKSTKRMAEGDYYYSSGGNYSYSHLNVFVPGSRIFTEVSHTIFINSSNPVSSSKIRIPCTVSSPTVSVRLLKFNLMTRKWKKISVEYNPLKGFQLQAGLGRSLPGIYKCYADWDSSRSNKSESVAEVVGLDEGTSITVLILEQIDPITREGNDTLQLTLPSSGSTNRLPFGVSTTPSYPQDQTSRLDNHDVVDGESERMLSHLPLCWSIPSWTKLLRSKRLECNCGDSYGLFVDGDSLQEENRRGTCQPHSGLDTSITSTNTTTMDKDGETGFNSTFFNFWILKSMDKNRSVDERELKELENVFNCSLEGDWRIGEFLENGEEPGYCYRDKARQHFSGSGSRVLVRVLRHKLGFGDESLVEEKGSLGNGNKYENRDMNSTEGMMMMRMGGIVNITVIYDGLPNWASGIRIGIRRNVLKGDLVDQEEQMGSRIHILNTEPTYEKYYPLAHHRAVWEGLVLNNSYGVIESVYVFQPDSFSYSWFPNSKKMSSILEMKVDDDGVLEETFSILGSNSKNSSTNGGVGESSWGTFYFICSTLVILGVSG